MFDFDPFWWTMWELLVSYVEYTFTCLKIIAQTAIYVLSRNEVLAIKGGKQFSSALINEASALFKSGFFFSDYDLTRTRQDIRTCSKFQDGTNSRIANFNNDKRNLAYSHERFLKQKAATSRSRMIFESLLMECWSRHTYLRQGFERSPVSTLFCTFHICTF